MDIKKKLFDGAYKQFSNGLFRFIYFKVSDYELAKDLTIDTFVRFWKNILKGEKIKNEKAFLYFIARGIVTDYYRKKSKSKHLSIEEIDQNLLKTSASFEEDLAKKQDLENIYFRLKKIKKEFQEVIVLRYVEDMEISEISQILKKKENAVRVLLHRALKVLKEKL